MILFQFPTLDWNGFLQWVLEVLAIAVGIAIYDWLVGPILKSMVKGVRKTKIYNKRKKLNGKTAEKEVKAETQKEVQKPITETKTKVEVIGEKPKGDIKENKGE
jgi:hypothetical protein